jgi:hypothetical protein
LSSGSFIFIHAGFVSCSMIFGVGGGF